MSEKESQPPSSEETGQIGPENLASRDEMLQVFKKGAEFTEELLKENERLRFRLAELEAKDASRPDVVVESGSELRNRLQHLEKEKEELAKRYSDVERENREFAERYVAIEQENNNLLNIYVASYQLHSTLDFQEVLGAITEVVLNFIGAEVFWVGVVDETTGRAKVLVTEGIDAKVFDGVDLGSGIVGEVSATGMPHFVSEIEDLTVDPKAPAICVPLKIKEQVIGVISIYKFLQQKKQLASVDHELFTLLAGHAATALFASKLYTDSKRKLNTIQGFIDLVTS